ncbi:hypothetical protein H2200_010422 [Cladophialophora chaetospira]|uniref:Uncharacterized protein n=1 Tax=Cladophialophora chaetospira TaxID=386627 RepID=A0AA39CE74_9EURO|nr:hypothetical protein H2200_010422 [Cladophialophora chaetospira]
MAPVALNNVSMAAKAKMIRPKRSLPKLFHKPQVRGALTPLSANTLGNRVDKVYDVVKPTFTSYKTTVTLKGPQGSKRHLKKKVSAPTELWQFKPIDQAAIDKPLRDLIEKARAEKEAKKKLERELDSLFESDDEDSPQTADSLEADVAGSLQALDLHCSDSDVLEEAVDWSKGDGMLLPASLAYLVGVYFNEPPRPLMHNDY